MKAIPNIGIIGGSGMLGQTIVKGLMRDGRLAADRIWTSNRSGSRSGFEEWPDITFTTDNQELCRACEVVVLSVPPKLLDTVRIDARNRLVISVMAGITIERIADDTRARSIIRAMSSPAAEIGLAYSPWFASADATREDREIAAWLFSAVGLTDEVPREADIDIFTAMTGPVPGFVARFAEAMTIYAEKNGIDRAVAERAICQLFLAAGTLMSRGPQTPADHVSQMIAYAGTTAAGLLTMQDSGIDACVAAGLDAAVQEAQRIGTEVARKPRLSRRPDQTEDTQ